MLKNGIQPIDDSGFDPKAYLARQTAKSRPPTPVVSLQKPWKKPKLRATQVVVMREKFKPLGYHGRVIPLPDWLKSPGSETTLYFMSEIVRTVREHFEIPKLDMLGPSRARPLARARQCIAWLAMKHTELSLPAIGRWLGGRDHSTVLHGQRKIDSLIAAKDPIAKHLEVIQAELFAGAKRKNGASK